MTKRRAIVLKTDTQRTEMLGCYGHAAMKTPNLDRLAFEGVCFDCASWAQPVCGPARYALGTGQFPFRTRDPFRGYSWRCRPWHEDRCSPTWDEAGMTRRRKENFRCQRRQLDCQTGREMEQAVRVKEKEWSRNDRHSGHILGRYSP